MLGCHNNVNSLHFKFSERLASISSLCKAVNKALSWSAHTWVAVRHLLAFAVIDQKLDLLLLLKLIGFHFFL